MLLALPVYGQAGQGNGAQTGDGSTPFTGLAQAPEANLFIGAAQTSIPIQLPPGRWRRWLGVGRIVNPSFSDAGSKLLRGGSAVVLDRRIWPTILNAL